ncbi:MAG: hypothetical protein ACRDKJ_15455 [Actinomycetota bacterium]
MNDRHDEKAIAFFGSWMVIGLFLDGWAHGANKPETFFSPWHFILYSGFGAAVGYFLFRDVVLKRSSEPDRLTTAGLVVFVIGAIGDGAWHQVFGIEVDLEALLSPTHLALMIGGIMMLGLAYRRASSTDAPGDRASTALIVTLTLCAAVTMFFTQYLTAFDFRGLAATPDTDGEFWEIYAVGSVFVTNAILLGLVFLLVRRWRTPRWTFTCVFAALATGMVLLNGSDGAFLNIPAAGAGGFAADVSARRFRPAESDRGARVFSILVPLVLWGAWFTGLHFMDGVHWAAELWTGTIILACLAGAGLGLLAFRDRPAARQAAVVDTARSSYPLP